MLIDINGEFKMLNAGGRVTKSRSGFQPVEADVIVARIERAKARIRSLNSAVRDMTALLN